MTEGAHLPALQAAGLDARWVAETGSTNSDLLAACRAAPLHEPQLLVAERQSAGRGRQGRSWISAPGDSLTFSLAWPWHGQPLDGLSLAVGTVLAETLDRDCNRLRLKWPNDLWWQDRKLAGILIEAATASGRSQVVIGIGINIRPRPAEGLSTPPAALAELWPEASAGAALLRLMPTLVHTLQDFEQQGFAPLQARFEARDVLRGREVYTSDGQSGLALGVGPTGALRLQQAGSERLIDSSEVSVRPFNPNAN